MARLHEYSPDSSQNGYHLKGWTKHSRNTTLQVRYPCKLLFDWLGYQEGDKIPGDLVTALLDSNLLHTKNGDTSIENVDWVPSYETIPAELSEKRRQRLLGFLREYDGPRRHYVRNLAANIDTGDPIPDTARLSTQTDFDRNWRACADSVSDGPDESLHRIAEQISKRPYGLPEDVVTSLEQWSDNPIEKFADIPDLEASVALFRTFPGRIHDVTPEEDYLTYFVTLPEADEEDPWPRFLVDHILNPQSHVPDSNLQDCDFEDLFRIQIVSHLPTPLRDTYPSDLSFHTTVVLDREIHGWKVTLSDAIGEVSDGEKAEIEDQIRTLEHEATCLMEHLLDGQVDPKVQMASVEYDC